VPDIGDFKDVSVIEVFVKPGDSIKVEQSLITVESDKASMEIPSSHAGVVQERQGRSATRWPGLAGGAAQGPGSAASPRRRRLPWQRRMRRPRLLPRRRPRQPRCRCRPTNPRRRRQAAARVAVDPRFARELGVPLAEVQGSGPKGRITQDDVQAFVKGVMAGSVQTAAQKAKAPAPAPARAGRRHPRPAALAEGRLRQVRPGRAQALSRIKKISGANLHRNWVMIPHVTNHDDADITELEAFRVQTNKENEKSGVKVTMLAFLIKAAWSRR
jgi:pyruvate dehydrogenase E2 component (dihydrolipoamide acetyltransferase)